MNQRPPVIRCHKQYSDSSNHISTADFLRNLSWHRRQPKEPEPTRAFNWF